MRTAFVTGGSRGIGRACAVALAAAGHRVAFCYSSDHEGAKESQAAVEAVGSEALAVQADVTDSASVDAAFDEIEGALGPVELLVNNAGVGSTLSDAIFTQPLADWRATMAVNLDAPFHLTQLASRVS